MPRGDFHAMLNAVYQAQPLILSKRLTREGAANAYFLCKELLDEYEDMLDSGDYKFVSDTMNELLMGGFAIDTHARD